MTPNYPTKQAASKLQVSPNTLRNWSDQYSDYLSESARSGFQPERKFTDQDMVILEYIKTLRSEGLKEEGIKQRLAETTFSQSEILQPTTNALQPIADVAPQTALATPGESAANLLIVSTLDAMQRRLEALEQAKPAPVASQRDNVLVFGVGFVAALLFVLLLIGLASLYGQ